MTRLEITEPTGQVEAWVPLPLMQKTAWFETLSNDIGGNAEQAKVAVDPVYGAGNGSRALQGGRTAAGGRGDEPLQNPRPVRVDAAGGWQSGSPAQELALYLKPTDLMPTDGIVEETALKITKGAGN